jgi:hypothetical protein
VEEDVKAHLTEAKTIAFKDERTIAEITQEAKSTSPILFHRRG